MKDRVLDFLEKDYELKINFLVAQFDRVWKRFQFFLTIQSGLMVVYLGLKIDSQFFDSLHIPLIGVFLCLIWFVLGSQDKYVIELYRLHVKKAGIQLLDNINQDNEFQISEIIVGDTNYGEIDTKWYQWRNSSVSATKLLALFPVIVAFIWVVALILQKGS